MDTASAANDHVGHYARPRAGYMLALMRTNYCIVISIGTMTKLAVDCAAVVFSNIPQITTASQSSVRSLDTIHMRKSCRTLAEDVPCMRPASQEDKRYTRRDLRRQRRRRRLRWKGCGRYPPRSPKSRRVPKTPCGIRAGLELRCKRWKRAYVDFRSVFQALDAYNGVVHINQSGTPTRTTRGLLLYIKNSAWRCEHTRSRNKSMVPVGGGAWSCGHCFDLLPGKSSETSEEP